MRHLCVLGLLICLGACGSVASEIEAYLESHPHTLLANAQALRKGEVIPDMLDTQVALLLGQPSGTVMKKTGRRQRVVASYKSDCRWVRGEKVIELKGPVSLVYELHESGEWRLRSARSIWR